MLPPDTTHLMQRPRYQLGNLCHAPAGNRITRRPDHRKKTQTAVVWTCLPFIRASPNHLARHSERRKNTRQTEEEVGRQHQGREGLEFAKSQKAVQYREKWKKLAVKSSVVPQRPRCEGIGEGEVKVKLLLHFNITCQMRLVLMQ